MHAYAFVLVYILYCIGIGTKPCKYFQLNAKFFDPEAGIFSKIAIDQHIPAPWKLWQCYDDGAYMPKRYPIFVKPEWSQNARGVARADDATQLRAIRAQLGAAPIRYLLQECARERHEYEIFYIRHHRDPQRWAVFSVTQVRNHAEPYPVNSVYNRDTSYHEITAAFSPSQQQRLWQLMQRIGDFNIARVSVRADSTVDLLRGKFHVIEVNLFLPMPINLLDRSYGVTKTLGCIAAYMLHLARITKHRDLTIPTHPVFTKCMLYNRRNPILNFLRARL